MVASWVGKLYRGELGGVKARDNECVRSNQDVPSKTNNTDEATVVEQ